MGSAGGELRVEEAASCQSWPLAAARASSVRRRLRRAHIWLWINLSSARLLSGFHLHRGAHFGLASGPLSLGGCDDRAARAHLQAAPARGRAAGRSLKRGGPSELQLQPPLPLPPPVRRLLWQRSSQSGDRPAMLRALPVARARARPP